MIGAAEDAREAIRLEPGWNKPYLRLASAEDTQGHRTEAVEVRESVYMMDGWMEPAEVPMRPILIYVLLPIRF